jgi:hypothetical protein
MYGYGRAYKSRMGPKQLFTSKIYKKSNFWDENIEKYALFGKLSSRYGKIFFYI